MLLPFFGGHREVELAKLFAGFRDQQDNVLGRFAASLRLLQYCHLPVPLVTGKIKRLLCRLTTPYKLNGLHGKSRDILERLRGRRRHWQLGEFDAVRSSYVEV